MNKKKSVSLKHIKIKNSRAQNKFQNIKRNDSVIYSQLTRIKKKIAHLKAKEKISYILTLDGIIPGMEGKKKQRTNSYGESVQSEIQGHGIKLANDNKNVATV